MRLQSLMDKRIKPWVNKKIIEYIGEEEPTLTDFICQKVMAQSQPQNILNDVAMVSKLLSFYRNALLCVSTKQAERYCTRKSFSALISMCALTSSSFLTFWNSFELM